MIEDKIIKDDPRDQFPKKQKGKLNVYMHVSENSGVGYYRQFLPAVKIREQNLANVMISDFRWGEGDHVEPGMDTLFDIADWADIIIVGRKDIPDFYAMWGGIREFFNLPVVMDNDDNVRFVNPDNPGYEGYHPGSPAVVMNQYGTAKVFDALTVSTEDLKEFHKKENPRIYILPNSIDVDWWDQFEMKKHNDGFIRAGFIASASHAAGYKIIKKPLLDLMKKHLNLKFVMTAAFAPIFEDFPAGVKERIEYVKWIPLKDWAKGLKDTGIDIGLAPLADNMFNRAKSNLRWLEYSACKIPTVASDVKPYRCIKNKKNGIICKEQDEWYEAIEKLIEDEKLRKTMGENAYKTVKEEFNVKENAQNWVKVYNEIVDKYRDFFGKKNRFIKIGKGKYRKLLR